MYGIWARVSGGITGTRAGWLKSLENGPELYDTLEQAAAEAARLRAQSKPTPYGARFEYAAAKFDDKEEEVK